MFDHSASAEKQRSLALRSFAYGVGKEFESEFNFDKSSLQPAIRQVTEAFSRNVIAAADVAHIPYLMVNQSVIAQRFHSFFTAQRIRAIPYADEHGKEAAERKAREEAVDLLAKYSESDEGKNNIAEEIVTELGAALRDSAFAESARELLRQTVVMLWGSVEVLAFDGLVALMNAKPGKAALIATAEPTKKHFQRGVPIELLAQHGYDVSATMGELLMAGLRSDGGQLGLPLIKDLCSVVCPDPELLVALNERQAWLLFQQRHLIVHRRAIVDRLYIEKTGSPLPIGTSLTLDRYDIERYFSLVGRIGHAMMIALDRDARA